MDTAGVSETCEPVWEDDKPHLLYQELLNIIQQLNDPIFLHRSFDGIMRQGICERLNHCRDGLKLIRLPADHRVHTVLRQAIDMFKTSDLNEPATFHERTRTSKLLLEVLESLVPGNLPLPNQHLPTDILHLIFDQVLLFDSPRARRSTIYSLAQTSVAWSKLALPKCRNEVFIDSIRELDNWAQTVEDREDLEEPRKLSSFSIDLAGEGMTERDATNLWAAFEGIKFETVSINLGKYEIDWRCWETILEVVGGLGDNYSIKIPVFDADALESVLSILIRPGLYDSKRREVYLNSQPVGTNTEVVKRIFGEDLNTLKYWPPESTNGDFIIFEVLAAPFVAFTVPLFLANDTRHGKARPLPPSKLEHLEITLEFDPSNPERAQREMRTFFEVISPKIERLALRLRVTRSHRTPLDESAFDNELIAGLLSCRRLHHLEIGGFGFSFLSLFKTFECLPLRTLGILPSYPQVREHGLFVWLQDVLEQPSRTGMNLRKFIRCFSIEDAGEGIRIDRLCRRKGIFTSFLERSDLEFRDVCASAESVNIPWMSPLFTGSWSELDELTEDEVVEDNSD